MLFQIKFKTRREQKQEEKEARQQQQQSDGELQVAGRAAAVDASEDEEIFYRYVDQVGKKVHYLGTVDPQYGKSNQSSSSPYHF
tara:strand:+ start:255 stop:506 length:252 start_codon:yes stop_codon:yes gene_type:complete